MRRKSGKKWYKLDNAARIYTNIVSNRVTSVFRLSATLTEMVVPDRLQAALDHVLARLPGFRVTLRSGIFWQFLQASDEQPRVQLETQPPCQRPDRKKDQGFLFRVLYYNRRISLECSHIIADGGGGEVFLLALVLEYLRLSGYQIPKTPGIPQCTEKPAKGDFEEAYRRFYDNTLPPVRNQERALALHEPLDRPGIYHLNAGIVPVNEILAQAKAVNCTLTEWLTAVFLDVLQDYAFDKRLRLRPIRMLVPVNLRKMFDSATLRNFFLPVEPEIDPRLGRYSFEEILNVVHHYMRTAVDQKLIRKQIRRNVGTERHAFIRYLPVWIKHLLGPVIYACFGSSQVTAMVTNLGRVPWPAELTDAVERFDFLPNPNPHTATNLAVLSYGDSLHLSFGSLCPNSELPKRFFTKLRELKIPLKLETN